MCRACEDFLANLKERAEAILQAIEIQREHVERIEDAADGFALPSRGCAFSAPGVSHDDLMVVERFERLVLKIETALAEVYPHEPDPAVAAPEAKTRQDGVASSLR